MDRVALMLAPERHAGLKLPLADRGPRKGVMILITRITANRYFRYEPTGCARSRRPLQLRGAVGVGVLDVKSLRAAAAEPPEAEPAHDESSEEEDRRLVPLERPVTAGGLIGQHVTYPKLVHAFLNKSVCSRVVWAEPGECEVGAGPQSFDGDPMRQHHGL